MHGQWPRQHRIIYLIGNIRHAVPAAEVLLRAHERDVNGTAGWVGRCEVKDDDWQTAVLAAHAFQHRYDP